MAMTCFRPSKANSDTSSSSCRGHWGQSSETGSCPASALWTSHYRLPSPLPSLLPQHPVTDCQGSRIKSTPTTPARQGPTLWLPWQNEPPAICFAEPVKAKLVCVCVADPLTSCFSKNGRMSSRAWWPMVECNCSKVLAAASLTSSSGSHKAFLAVGTRDSEKYSTCNSTRVLYLIRWRPGGSRSKRGPLAQPRYHHFHGLTFNLANFCENVHVHTKERMCDLLVRRLNPDLRINSLIFRVSSPDTLHFLQELQTPSHGEALHNVASSPNSFFF